MKVAIVRREERTGRSYRVLACGHEQEELDPAGELARVAVCRLCGAAKAREQVKPRPTPPADTRTELQRLADELETVYHFPAERAWGRQEVLVRKLINAARSHECPTTAKETP